MGDGCYYITNTITTFLFFSFFFSPSMALSSLPQNQFTTMKNLSDLLAPSVPSWSIANDSNPCHWNGVTCDNTSSSVTGIKLSGYSLSSSVFLPLLCQIDTLEHLDLSNNLLTSIPDDFITDCGKINVLKLLNFTANQLKGDFPVFRGFDALESLDMSFNEFRGSAGLVFDEMVSLKSLNLSFNDLSGSLPTKLGNSMALEQLVLSGNQFLGGIPEEILSYQNLTLIDLRDNKLSGHIPSNVGKLSKLESLILSSNILSGPIPPSLMNITTLQRFAANQNNFTGPVPRGISKYLASLDLSYNQLSGSIPQDLLSPSNLQLVDLSNNSLDGKLPAAKISPSMVRLRLGGNLLSGTIPSEAFASALNLTYLELENNNLEGVIPPILGSCQNLSLLNLFQNRLIGELPQELGNLHNLQVLKLHMNELNGTIPLQIAQLQKLSTLNLSSNSLSGPVPEISGSSKLAFLNLQGNRLSGTIPASIGNLRNLLELQLGENQLGGVIPSMPSSLQVALNLSRNQFSGSIPSSFGNLDKLEILDLSYNRFSGPIPDYLIKMSALTQLIVSNNQLNGTIPSFPPYVTVEWKGGNDHLDPPKQDDTPTSFSPTSAKKGISVVVAIFIAIAAAILLVVVVTVLIILVSRRFYRVNDEHFHSGGGNLQRPPEVIQSNLLTQNGVHRSNIDFSKAMEAIAETSNVTLKTRFSTYYKAIMPSGSTYFVKKLNWTDKALTARSNNKFVKELEGLAKLNNSNVMVPLAYVLSTDTAYLLYEFVPNGSLYDVLHGSMEHSLDWASRYSIAVGMAQGLSFLHGFASGPMLLLDLSSKSIMLKSLKEPLVGDIEHYKVIDPSRSTGNFSAVAGSVGYIPPEYAYTMTVTMAGNVYSFGVILLELLTGKPAVTEGTELVKWVLRNSANKDYILDLNVSRTSQAVRNQMLTVLQIALVCVSTAPEARPKMKSVLRMLLNAR